MGDFCPSGFVCLFLFKGVINLFERERREKPRARGADGEGEAGSLQTGSLPWELDHDLSLRQ